jgi:ribosome biogenesis GTPase / thiamine phosphate phosphatase
MEKLNQYGWNNYTYPSQYQEKLATENLARVVSVKGQTFEIATNKGLLKAELLGRLLFALETWEQPKSGDWVVYINYGESALISEVLPRMNQLYRKTAGRQMDKQVMVANVDQAIVIQGLDHDFNLKRLERYLIQIVGCGIQPVVVLNKCDLAKDIQYFRDEIARL